LGAHSIDWFPRGILRIDARSLHIIFGTILAALISGRLAWRWTRGRFLPSNDHGALKIVATAVHGLLYLLLVATISLGLTNAWIRGDSLFGLITIPKLAVGGKALRDEIQNLHGLAANAILVVAALHASAAIWHQYWRRDGLLSRMIPALTSIKGQ
jgi:cytochrome b561